MKILFKKLLQYYLKYITKLVLILHRPTIIAIAGSTNKTFVKDEIGKVLKEQGTSVRLNPKSFNTEIGLPLAILKLPSGYNSYKNWLPIILKALKRLVQFDFPKYLVLELGISDPGDMKYLLSIIKPKIVVITDITQRYIEGFDDMDDLIDEYEYLVKKTKKNSTILLNYDNERIKNLAKISDKYVYYGLKDGSLWQAVEIKKETRGLMTKVSHNDIVKEYIIHSFGEHHVYALLIGLIIKEYVKKEKKV